MAIEKFCSSDIEQLLDWNKSYPKGSFKDLDPELLNSILDTLDEIDLYFEILMEEEEENLLRGGEADNAGNYREKFRLGNGDDDEEDDDEDDYDDDDYEGDDEDEDQDDGDDDDEVYEDDEESRKNRLAKSGVFSSRGLTRDSFSEDFDGDFNYLMRSPLEKFGSIVFHCLHNTSLKMGKNDQLLFSKFEDILGRWILCMRWYSMKSSIGPKTEIDDCLVFDFEFLLKLNPQKMGENLGQLEDQLELSFFDKFQAAGVKKVVSKAHRFIRQKNTKPL